MRVLAVCSDQTAGYDPQKEGKRSLADNPTADNSNVSASEVIGLVTTDAGIIADWIASDVAGDAVNVIFGTYQSGHRVADALKATGVTVSVLIADEAHRTAGLPRNRARDKSKREKADKPLRDFALCHDNDAFPARYRVYQTATPRVYGPEKVTSNRAEDWIVRSMDDETIFGVDLFRKSYVDAVRNGWLADYRIIAIGINDPAAYERANALANENPGKGRNPLTTSDYLRGLAFAMAMGGATRATKDDGSPINIKSCIAFLNTVDKSKTMAQMLQTDDVREWLAQWLNDNAPEVTAARYELEHVDASSNVTARDNAKNNLANAAADDAPPHGVTNVGIFGEGTDSPTLSAVAFLEQRKSPIDVIQAVGRAMRTAPGKQYGYIICPILIPPNADPEEWLKTSNQSEWPELGQILLALRAHDSRIEDELEDLLQLHLPKSPMWVHTFIAIGNEDLKIDYYEHAGGPGTAQEDVRRILKDDTPSGEVTEVASEVLARGDWPADGDEEPTQVITGKRTGEADGETELRIDSVPRDKADKGHDRGPVNPDKLAKLAEEMLNERAGTKVSSSPKEGRKRPTRAERTIQQALNLLEWDENANAIKMNLLARSGLTSDRVTRDLNLLEAGIKEAAHHLHQDDLRPVLDRHFGLDNLKPNKDKPRADGVTIGALLMMNAAMLHQRIANGRWMSRVDDLLAVANRTNVVEAIKRQWNAIISRDFKPVVQPALDVIHTVEDTGKLSGLERALRHLASEAARIAETYADMGADHAGPLFNRVMGDQSSDGAFFTRPTAASLLARLALDAAETSNTDWTSPETWKRNRTVDLACGSGTLLAAVLTDMKRRAREQGASQAALGDLHKLAVEETIHGLDINPVSLQLAASRLTAGNHDIAFRRMGLHLMPYGPTEGDTRHVAAGSLELLSQSRVVGDRGTLIADQEVGSSEVWNTTPAASSDDPELEDAVDAATGARIVIMNPPFTNRTKMGEKFADDDRDELRCRVDALRNWLLDLDSDAAGLGDKGSIGPMFHALADRCVHATGGVLALVGPTISFSSPANLKWRKELARRFHVHTIVTCHDLANSHMAEGTKGEHHSLIVLRRHSTEAMPTTRKIALDRFPYSEAQVEELHRAILACDRNAGGMLADGWGEVSQWHSERIADGDWTSGIWRSPELANARHEFSTAEELNTMGNEGLLPRQMPLHATAGYERSGTDVLGSFPVVGGAGVDDHTCIRATANQWWKYVGHQGTRIGSSEDMTEHPLSGKEGRLLVTEAQGSRSARLTAMASNEPLLGRNWQPVANVKSNVAKGLAVFLNSTPGRIQLMSNAGRSVSFPYYREAGIRSISVPPLHHTNAIDRLAACWEATRDKVVFRYDEGECEVRQIWDEAVSEAMGGKGIWSKKNLERLRKLLHREPHVCGKPYGHYST